MSASDDADAPLAAKVELPRIPAVLVNPQWEAGTMEFNGLQLPVVTVVTPNGRVACLVAPDTLRELIAMLTRLAGETMQ